MQLCFLLSRESLRFLGSVMGIAIANRKNRCDFGALRFKAKSGFLNKLVGPIFPERAQTLGPNVPELSSVNVRPAFEGHSF